MTEKPTMQQLKNEPKKHHYIPQFLLRNFCDDKGQLFYWSNEKRKLENRNPRSVFMNVDMYRDEENHEDNPTFIESNLGKFEQEIALLVSDKILNKAEVVLTRVELESLRIFLSLLSFRSDSRMKQYKEKHFFGNDVEVLRKYTKDGNFEDLWKREIEAISSCRSYEELEKNETITPTIKMEFLNDLNGMFMTIVDARGGEFLISDIYPTLEILPVAPTINLHMHILFPISSYRMLLLNNIAFKSQNSSDIARAMYQYSQIKDKMIIQPKNQYVCPGLMSKNDKFIYKPQKIYEQDVSYINALILNEAKIGVAFRDKTKVLSAISSFNNRNDVKQKYEDLENILAQ